MALRIRSFLCGCAVLATSVGGFSAPAGGRGDFLNALGPSFGRVAPVQAPRARLDESFAVQLMRTSYQVCEELKFVPMDQFQKEFYLYRADEWLPYRDRCARFVLQGSLGQPEYLDFISFCQYHIIEQCMRKGQLEFVERVGAEGETRTVRRPDALRDNKLLYREHTRRVGKLLLDHLRERCGATDSYGQGEDKEQACVTTEGAVDASKGSHIGEAAYRSLARPARFEGRFAILDRSDCRKQDDLVKGVEQAVRCMAICGYGSQWTALPEISLPDAKALGAPPRLRLSLSGSGLPTAWGQKRLAREGNTLRNDFEVKVAQAWLQRQGIASLLVKSTVVGECDVLHTIELLNG